MLGVKISNIQKHSFSRDTIDGTTGLEKGATAMVGLSQLSYGHGYLTEL